MEAGPRLVPISKKRCRRFKLTQPKKHKKTEEPVKDAAMDDDATEHLVSSDENNTIDIAEDMQKAVRFSARMRAKKTAAAEADIEEPSVVRNAPAAAASDTADLEAAKILQSFKVDNSSETNASGSSTAVSVSGSNATAVARGRLAPKKLLTGPADNVDAKSVANWISNVRADTKVLGAILEVPESENVKASKPKSNKLKPDEQEPKNTKGKSKSSSKSMSRSKEKEKTIAVVDIAQGVEEAKPIRPKTGIRKTSTIAKEVMVVPVEPENAASGPGPSAQEAKRAPSPALGPTTRRTTRTRRRSQNAIEAVENAAQAPKGRSTTRKKAAVAAASSTELK
ncbi:hypothetical protein NEOLEDRAFT_947278 [Neolentinus lepideus HHB14362 ss-1]|uniref:Uncharacterized protein n=1 Tax=Neolentinus lepideus HHB14362 ss-1 TaxID=1314782 RepID=A0A165UCE5_9AGAM|nr:hypothetical protein NEOLEDRAFT_947278 [Neolentinus lepideus HHB14362 ss-1]